MKLSELKQFISGAIRFKETEKGIVLCRFTTEQMKIYENHELRLLRANTCTGVKMSFVTD